MWCTGLPPATTRSSRSGSPASATVTPRRHSDGATCGFAETPTPLDDGSPRDGGTRRREEAPTMVSAYILIQTEVGKAGQVTMQIGDIAGVVTVDPVTGPYDVVAKAEAEDLDLLAKGTVMPIQALDGITRTLTCPVLQL